MNPLAVMNIRGTLVVVELVMNIVHIVNVIRVITKDMEIWVMVAAMLKVAMHVSGARVANTIRNVMVQPALGIVRGVPAAVLDNTSHKHAPHGRILYAHRAVAAQVAAQMNTDPGVGGAPLATV